MLHMEYRFYDDRVLMQNDASSFELLLALLAKGITVSMLL